MNLILSLAVTIAVSVQPQTLADRLKTDSNVLAVLADISHLPADQSMATFKQAWLSLPGEPKRQVMANIKLSQPSLQFSVLELGVRDSSLTVQTFAMQELGHITLQPPSFDYPGTLRWLKKNRNRPPEEVRKEKIRTIIHDLLSKDGRDLDFVANQLSTIGEMSELPPSWPAEDRRRIFHRMFDQGTKTKRYGPLKFLYRDAAMAVGMSSDDIRTDLAKLWYTTDDGDLPTRITATICKASGDWPAEELLNQLRFVAAHPDDASRSNGLTDLGMYFWKKSDTRVLPEAIHAIQVGPADWSYAIGYYLVGGVAGVRYDARHDKAWWANWWTCNEPRFVGAHETRHFTDSDEQKSNAKVAKILGGTPEEKLAGAKAEWSALSYRSKQLFLVEAPRNGAPNTVAVLELGLLDPDLSIQNASLDGLSKISLRQMADDYIGTKAWVVGHRDMKLGDVRKESSRKLADRLLRLSPSELAGEIRGLSELLVEDWMTESWTQEERDLLFDRAIESLDGKYVGDGDSSQVVSAAERFGCSPEKVKRFLPLLDHPENEGAYCLGLTLLSGAKAQWAQDALLEQVRLLADNPSGPRAANVENLTLMIKANRDERFIPQYIRAIIVGQDEWRYWLDYYGLATLTGVSYDELHDGAWWLKWWEKNKSKYPTLASIEMPSLPKAATHAAVETPPPSILQMESFDSLATRFVAFANAGGCFDMNEAGKWATVLRRADPVRAIPYLVSAMVAYGGVLDYDFGYYQVCQLAGVPYMGVMDAQWWGEWWAKNYLRFPTVPKELPKITLFAREKGSRSIVPEVKKDSVPIRAIDPADDNYSDLEPLRKAIGDSQVVQLGEQSHGDGAAFYAKMRIVKFLHEKCGFDVLAWESGMFDCDQMSLAVGAGKRDAAAKGIFPIWSETPIVSRLFDYAATTYKTKRPLEMTGVDCQFSGKASDGFGGFVKSFFEKAGIPLTEPEKEGLTNAMSLLLKGDSKTMKSADAKAVFDGLSARLVGQKGAAEKACGVSETERMGRYLANASVYVNVRDNGSGGPEITNLRDHRMGENLVWMANGPYKNKKIIVWAASFHLMHNAPTINTLLNGFSYATTVNMGQGVHEALGKRVYTLAFLAHYGSKGNTFFGARLLEASPEGSVEELMHRDGSPYAFVDLRTAGPWWREPRVARPLGYASMRARWTDVFDGFFFTDVMFWSGDPAIPVYARPEGIGDWGLGIED